MYLDASLALSATFVLFQLCTLAQDYSRNCSAPDENRNTPDGGTGSSSTDVTRPLVAEQCDVYVWGSNSSHQLAEGSQEKVMQPKLATAFESVRQVRTSFSL